MSFSSRQEAGKLSFSVSTRYGQTSHSQKPVAPNSQSQQIESQVKLPHIARHKNSPPQIDEKDLSDKVRQMLFHNHRHELEEEICVCEDCIYAKQLDRNHHKLNLDLSKSSSYQSQYNRHLLKREQHRKNQSNLIGMGCQAHKQGDTGSLDSGSRNNSSPISKSAMLAAISSRAEDNMSKGKPVDMDSSYKKQFEQKSIGRIDKPKPEDMLRFNGPSTSFSSYQAGYRSINTPSQYYEPLKNELLPSRKFKSSSVYSDSFSNNAEKTVITESGRNNDQLKLGKPSLVKQSTNQSLFSPYNPQKVIRATASKDYSKERIQAPRFSHQYKTINRNEFESPVVEKKHCRSRRRQAMHGDMVTSGLHSTIS